MQQEVREQEDMKKKESESQGIEKQRYRDPARQGIEKHKTRDQEVREQKDLI